MRRNASTFVALLLGTLASSGAARALELELTAVQFPERRTVSIDFDSQPPHAGAALSGRVSFRAGQGGIDLSFEHMRPAVLFEGDVIAYVVWAIYRDGLVENLGELPVRDSTRGRAGFTTSGNNFALLVTAETHVLVIRPSALVIAVGKPGDLRGGRGSAFTFDNFAAAPAHEHANVTARRYAEDVPVELVQARRMMEIARRAEAPKYAEDIMAEARTTLAQANNLAAGRGARTTIIDFAHRTVALANEAIRTTERKLEAMALEEQIAQRRAEMAAIEGRLAEAEGEMTRMRLTHETLQRETLRLVAEKSEIELAMDDLRAERELLANRLEGALSQVAETRQSARGLIVNLPDILFAFDSADLKAESKITLAQLAGILHIMPELNLRVEGHTDSVGRASYNLQLSERRADSVFDFLAEQGIAAARMTTAGYGMDRPIASNDTEQGRARNRRVEIVIAEGEIGEE